MKTLYSVRVGKGPRAHVCGPNVVYFWILRECLVIKEIKEMLAFRVHRYSFCCSSFARDKT